MGWNILYLSVTSIWSNVSFKDIIPLLIFCLSTDVSGVGVNVPYYYCVAVNLTIRRKGKGLATGAQECRMPHVEITHSEGGKAEGWRTGPWVILQHEGGRAWV